MAGSNGDVSPPTMMKMMLGDGTPKKAFFTALVVGTLLGLINHGDMIFAGEPPPAMKIILTYCVPYCVTTWGAVIGKRAQWQKDHFGSLKIAR
jgi:hypothetical protein